MSCMVKKATSGQNNSK